MALTQPDRRRPSGMELVPIAMLVLQLAALIWGAGALKTSVDELRETMRAMSVNVKEVQTTTTALSIDVGILKAQSVKR